MFEYCLPQGHYQHGRIERRIRMLQECLDRSEVRNSRCTALGWQCIAKAIERECNSIPIGFLHHQGTANPLLRVLCPSLLKMEQLLTELLDICFRFQILLMTSCQR